jgi:hypothetical protein
MGTFETTTDASSTARHLHVRVRARLPWRSLYCSGLLMNHLEDSIEVSYNSAGVLAHLCADGPLRWQQALGDWKPITPGDRDISWAAVQAAIVEVSTALGRRTQNHRLHCTGH